MVPALWSARSSLGPRLGKYGPDGKPRAIPGHNMSMAVIGAFLLFLGWFGFNGGSALSADPALVSQVFVTTALAGAAGSIFAMFTSAATNGGKVDLSMVLNGMLAGLVGITAGADAMTPLSAIIVGAIAGVIVVFSVYFFDRVHVDDPVGACSVHLVCGMWGTIAVGIFGNRAYLEGLYPETMAGNIVVQVIGTVVCVITSALFAGVIFGILKVAGGIRVSEHEEIEGLDIGEHGMHAYPDFAIESFNSPGVLTMPGRPAPTGTMRTA